MLRELAFLIVAIAAFCAQAENKVFYAFDKGEAYLGVGSEPKHAMDKEPWADYANGHFSFSVKGDAPASIRVELRTRKEGDFIFSGSAAPEWKCYRIPFDEFRRDGKRLDLKSAKISQIALLPGGKGKESHSMLLDKVSISKEPLAIPETQVFVSGKVLDEAGKGVEGVKILLTEKIEKIAESTSAPDGSYSLQMKARQSRCLVDPPSDEAFSLHSVVLGEKDGFLTSVNPALLKSGSNRCDMILRVPRQAQELKVVENRLQAPDGKNVWLQGVCVDSLEWSATGENILYSIAVALDLWKGNCIRLPVLDKFWFGQSEWQSDGGESYRKLIDAAVEATAVRGAWLAIDLHRFGAPMPEHVEFWKSVATRYRNHPAVLFDLFNEPHGISWKIWRDGGDIRKADGKDANAAENSEKNTGHFSPGMQAMLDAVRETGARNIVIAGGLDWGYDLSGIMKGCALQEREGGNGIMYSTHIYPWKTDWEGKVLVAAAKHPLFIGEVGCKPEPMPWQKSGTENPATWAPDMIACIQKHKLNWTAFSFHPGCGPKAILDWQYTPSPYWGAFVKDALAGKIFELKKMR